MAATNAIDQARVVVALLAMCFCSTNALASTLFSYTGPSVPIPDNNPAGVNAVLSVSGLGAITDLNFRLKPDANCSSTPGDPDAAIIHTFAGNLVIRLTSPQGTTATLINRRGGALMNFCFVELDDDGNHPPVANVAGSNGTFYGTYIPDSPLSVFDGESPNGQWVLNVSDNAAANTGIFKRFELLFETVPNDIVVDLIDDPSPGSCTPGSCSLREAVTLANSRFGPDRILLPAASLQLTRAGANDDNNLTGDLDVTDDLEIAGVSSNQTSLTQTSNDRLIHGVGSTRILTLRDLTLQGGNSVVQGGAILAENNLTISDAVFSGNRATSQGGAIYHLGQHSADERKLLLQRVVFNDNHATNTTAANAWGGALYSFASGGSSRFSLIDTCLFTNNRADNGGGAIALAASFAAGGATTRVARSTFSQNQVSLAGGKGGAITTQPIADGNVYLDISDSTFTGNSVRTPATAASGDRGGAVSVSEVDTAELRSVTNSVFELNFAYSGGAIHNASGDITDSTFRYNSAVDSGGALTSAPATLNIYRSTLNNNMVSTTSTSSFGGGALAVQEGYVSIQHSTLDGNSALRGGAIAFAEGNLSLGFNTMVSPTGLPAGALGTLLRHTGTSSSDSLNFINNILIGQCSYSSASVAPDGASFNIESNSNSCRLLLPVLQLGNQVSVAAGAINLGVLADNGGPTETRLPQAPSIAIDGGYILACSFDPLDQRGYFRTDSRCDIGSVEAGGMQDSVFDDGFDAD